MLFNPKNDFLAPLLTIIDFDELNKRNQLLKQKLDLQSKISSMLINDSSTSRQSTFSRRDQSDPHEELSNLDMNLAVDSSLFELFVVDEFESMSE